MSDKGLPRGSVVGGRRVKNGDDCFDEETSILTTKHDAVMPMRMVDASEAGNEKIESSLGTEIDEAGEENGA